MTKRVVLKHESHELNILTEPKIKAAMFCDTCSKEVRWLNAREAAALALLSERALFRGIEAGKFHVLETDDLAVIVCVESLVAL